VLGVVPMGRLPVLSFQEPIEVDQVRGELGRFHAIEDKRLFEVHAAG
jgi:hypothetical protein